MTGIAKLSDYDRASDRSRAIDMRRARTMLARMIPYGRWSTDKRPSPYSRQLWLLLARELMSLAALTPDEERAVRIALELDEAEAALEAGHGTA